ncbi:MAG: protease inhibitor I42 family protein [Candidatus Riflebacteria bacterium]|nr:protease inhibitor I42 family protein [Candidatus Riflebacteria bacterium]
MKKCVLLVLAVFIGMSCIAFAANQGCLPLKGQVVGEKDNGNTVTIQKGQDILISLPENGTTGYRWTVENFTPSVLEQQESTYKPDSTSGNLTPIGSGGTRTISFLGKKIGSSKLELHYSRPWEENSKPAKVFAITIIVKQVEIVPITEQQPSTR